MLDMTYATDAVDVLLESRTVSQVDLEFGRLLRRLESDPERGFVLQVVGTIVSSYVRQGQTRVPLADVCERAIPGLPEGCEFAPPARRDAEAACAGSPLVGDGSQLTPLVQDNEGRLALYRYWQAERSIARRIAKRLGAATASGVSNAVREQFAKLFAAMEDPVDWQAVAAAGALRHRFAIIAGGPGTGKTTTVAKLIALLLSAEPEQRIVLAAPTGKAAKRLGASIESQAAALEVSDGVRDRIPTEAKTIHRLLGYHPHRNRYRHDATNPLDADVLIIDECSMVDALLFDAMLDALPDETRVVLLGDPDQLPSVDAGFVFGDLCATASGNSYSSAFADFCCDLMGREVPAEHVGEGSHPLVDSVVTLRKNYRFHEAPGISRLAVAIREGDDEAIRKCLGGEWSNVVQRPHPAHPREALQDVIKYAIDLCREPSPEVAMAKLEDLQVLCATYWGDWGVHRMNEIIEAELLEAGTRTDARWYHGRPVLVTANDYGVGLFNGDVGLCRNDGGRAKVWFEDGSGGYRQVDPAKLPAHESAWAMTIHKSQGSEFGEVVLVLPNEPIEMLTRELLYSAATRAKNSLQVVGGIEDFIHCAQRSEERVSGVCQQVVNALAAFA